MLRSAAAGSVATAVGGSSFTATKTAFVGNSLMDPSYSVPQAMQLANGLVGGPLQVVANIGVAGETVGQVLSRIHNDVNNANPGLLNSGAQSAVLQIGTNNARGGHTINSGDQAAYVSLIAAILTHVSVVFVLDVPPIGPTHDNGSGVNSFNAFLDTLAASNVIRIHDTTTVNDGSGSWISGQEPSDGIHFAGSQAGLMGFAAQTDLAAYFSGKTFPSPLSTAAGDDYAGHQQWIAAYLNAGTGGSNSLAGGGTLPTGWAVGQSGSGMNATTRKDAASGGDPNQTPWAVLAPTVSNMGGGAFLVQTSLAGASITSSFPAGLAIDGEIKFTNFSGDLFQYLEVAVYGSGNEYLTPRKLGWIPLTANMNGSVILRVAQPRIRALNTPVAHPSGAVLQFTLPPGVAHTGAMGEIAWRNFTARSI